MSASQIISCLLLLVWSLVVGSQNVSKQNETLNHPVASEGGPIVLPSNDTTHMGREYMMKVPLHSNDTSDKHMIKVNHTVVTNVTTEVPAFEVGQKNDNKTSVPKKDATLSESRNVTNSSSGTHSSTTSTTTTTKTTSTTKPTTTTKPHKPTLTIGEDEEPSNPSKTKTNDTQNHGLSIESVVERPKKTDYVVPIVAVILSVPIVAIVFSVLYKRGSDWWQHRHYRRMDFLIEGMYNN